jgi:tetratricopeptide (TPR) repeat protein
MKSWIGAALLLWVAGAAIATPTEDGNAGLDAFDRGDFASAVAMFTKALNSHQLSKDDEEFAFEKRGSAYLRLGDYRSAVADLEQALKLKPDDQDAQTQLDSALYHKAGANGGGASAGPEGGRDTPAQAIADATAGLAALNRSAPGEAIPLFTRAIESGALANDQVELAYLSRGKAYLLGLEHKKAIADLNAALHLNPADQEAQTAFSNALMGLRSTEVVAPVTREVCAANYGSEGNFIAGRTSHAWAEYPSLSPVDAFAGAFAFLINEKFEVKALDLGQGTISASAQIPHSPRSVLLDVKVEPSGAGSKVTMTITIGSLLIGTDIKGYLCKGLASVASG